MGDVDPWAEFERLSRLDPAHFTHAQRRLLALGELRADVNNGGFDQYFFNSAGDLVLDALDAAEASGVTELVLLIRRALDVLSVQDPADREARQDALDDLDPEHFADIDDAYYALEASADLDSAMRGFITSCPRRSRSWSQECHAHMPHPGRMLQTVGGLCRSCSGSG